jgi:hypothetical protein
MVWDVTSGKAIQSFNPGIEPEAGEDGLHAVAFSPAGDRALVVDWRGRRSLWDLASASRLGGLADETMFDSAAFLPDGDNALVWGINAAGVALVATSTWKIQRRISDRSIGPFALAPRGDMAVAWQSSWDKSYAFRFAPAGGPIVPVGQVAAAMAAVFSADGRRLFVGEASGGIAVWDVASGSVRELRPPATRRVVACEADDSRVTLMGEQPLKMWIRDEVDTVRALAISPDGKRLAVGSKSLFLLDAETGRPLPDWHGHEPWTPEDTTEVILLSEALGLRPDPRWPAAHREERSPLDEPALLDEELSARQLESLNRDGLFVARNLVPARRGRQFKSAVLRHLFEGTAWYKPDPAYTEARLTNADRSNLRRMAAREKLLGGRMSERQFVESSEREGAQP